jgi:hypothetical protein
VTTFKREAVWFIKHKNNYTNFIRERTSRSFSNMNQLFSLNIFIGPSVIYFIHSLNEKNL